jgi:hypothetical protein
MRRQDVVVIKIRYRHRRTVTCVLWASGKANTSNPTGPVRGLNSAMKSALSKPKAPALSVLGRPGSIGLRLSRG